MITAFHQIFALLVDVKLSTVVAQAVSVHAICELPSIVWFHPIVESHDNVSLSAVISVAVNVVIVEAHATFKSQSNCVSHFILASSFTVRLPVIVTSHKYQARAEKSHSISVPFDSVKM